VIDWRDEGWYSRCLGASANLGCPVHQISVSTSLHDCLWYSLLFIIYYCLFLLIFIAARSKAWVCGRSLCWDCGFESRWGHGCLSAMSVVCCRVEFSASG
jgi:hypothetical protein